MLTTETSDTIGMIKDAIYRVWEKNLNLEDVSNTQPKLKSFHYHISSTPTSLSIDLAKIYKTAEIWNVLNRNITTLISNNASLSTTQKYKLDVPSLLSLLDKETFDFCNRRSILSEAEIYYKLIYETFQNIKDIKIILQLDYEIDNLKMVRFDVKIRDEVDNILRREDKFYENIRKLISADSMMNFVLTTQVV